MLLKLLLAWLQRTLNLFAWRIDFSSFVIYTAYLCMEFLCITTYGNFAAKEHFSLCCPFSCSVWPSLLAKQYLHVILRVMRGIGCKYSERELPKFFDCLDIIWYGWNIFAYFFKVKGTQRKMSGYCTLLHILLQFKWTIRIYPKDIKNIIWYKNLLQNNL